VGEALARRAGDGHDASMGATAAVGGARLLEREPVLDQLRQALGDARAGRGRLVLVGGEAGVGKSAVVRGFADEARTSTRVLWGGCDALFTPRPLGPFLDIAEEAGGELQSAMEDGPPEIVGALLRSLSPRTATIVVLEDVHWADEATLDTLRLLTRKIGQVPLLVLATYRDDELDRVHPLRVVLGELATRAQVERLTLPPLSPEAVAELAALVEVDPVALHRLTGGNPFFVTEVLASGDAAIPATVRDAVLARATRLSGDARALLDAVAIAPPRVELWLLEALAGEGVEALEECLSSGMLVEASGAIEFRHELARRALEESLEPRRRLSLHRSALAALADRPADDFDLARLAHHAEAAGDVEAVLRFAPAAGARAASLGAHREAAGQYARALRFGDSLSAAERAELLERRSRALYLTDRNDEAIEAAEEALEFRREVGDRLEEGDALRWLSDILWCPGRATESARTAREAVALLEQLPPGAELARAYANLATSCASAARADEAVMWGERVFDLAERLGETEIAVHALTTVGGSQGPRGTAKLERSLARARQARLHEQVARTYLWLVGTGLSDARPELVQRHLAAGIEFCSDWGLERDRIYLLAYQARFALEQGRWAEAGDGAAATLRISRSSITPRIVALVALGLVRARRGDPGQREALDEAWALAEPTGELTRFGFVAAARAEAAWLRGDRAAVDEATDGVLELALERGFGMLAGELAAWRRRAGHGGEVAAGVAEPYALQLAGSWERAAERWRELGRPYEAALALADAADEEPLRRALAELQRLEARPAAAMVARRLHERGVRGLPRGPRPSTRRNEAQLTPRELDVLRLLADGRRNAAIAEQLFLSPRTVEHHVSAILRKLGVQSRGQAVAEATRLALLQQA
jgi:DNA-binding CsgD family transcriptional regulator/tetratricopeptide (TPR) repeat protein